MSDTVTPVAVTKETFAAMHKAITDLGYSAETAQRILTRRTIVMSVTFAGVLAKALAVAEKVKADVVKAAAAVDGVVVKLQGDEPEIAAVVNAAVPGASTYVDLGLSALESLASVLDAGGAAAEQNLTNSGLDTTLIAKIKGVIPAIKKL
jgi:hypothetical protein